MALSMLTACGSSSSTNETTTVETTTNTTVVSYVQANMSASTGKYVVGSGQAAQILTGNETADEKKAASVIKFMAHLSSSTDETYTVLDDVADFANIDFSTNAGETVVYVIGKGDYDTETDLAQEILAKMVARKNDGVFSIATISCFDLTVDYSNLGMVNATLNGTTLGIDSDEYWVLVVTTAKAKTETDNGYTTGKA